MSHKPLILCIDDETRPLMMRKLLLEVEGYNVLTAATEEEAIDVTRTNPINLAITDQLLIKTTGVELAAKLKAISPDLPVLLLTGLIDLPTCGSNIDAVMSKLEGPEAFLEAVAQLLRHGVSRQAS